MRVVHLCLGSFYPDGYSYQENMLPKFHKKQGHHVEVIASLQTFDKNGKTTYMPEAKTYQNEYDIKVIRLEYKKPATVYHKMKRYVGTYKALEETNPEVLFIHGCQFMDMDIVVRYLEEHPGVRVYVDNHADYSNSGTNWLSKNILHKIFWRHTAQIINPYTTKFYGVLPARVDWLVNMYHLPKEKCELLVMGADDDMVAAAAKPEVRKSIREKYEIADDDFLVMTGGKIDQWKTQTLLLMQAIQNIKSDKVKLIVFGSVTSDLQSKVNALSDGRKVQYIGWIQSQDSYQYFAASDLVVFPGRHSVFWEQVAAQGIPMLCKKWDGTTHIDIGGNVEFLIKDSDLEIQERIECLINNPEKYQAMKKSAEEKGKMFFSYESIAGRALK